MAKRFGFKRNDIEEKRILTEELNALAEELFGVHDFENELLDKHLQKKGQKQPTDEERFELTNAIIIRLVAEGVLAFIPEQKNKSMYRKLRRIILEEYHRRGFI